MVDIRGLGLLKRSCRSARAHERRGWHTRTSSKTRGREKSSWAFVLFVGAGEFFLRSERGLRSSHLTDQRRCLDDDAQFEFLGERRLRVESTWRRS